MSDVLTMPLIHDKDLGQDLVGEVTRVFRRRDFYVEPGDPIIEIQVGRDTLTVSCRDEVIIVNMHAYPGNKVTAGTELALVSWVGTYDGVYNHGKFANAVFIAYRRTDSAGHTGRIYDRIVHDIGRWHVFRDIGSITPGADFRKQVRKALAHARVMLVVIGAGWLDAHDESGNRRLNDPEDLHRAEIRTALEREIPVIPVLVGRTPMPKPSELPDDIQSLSYRAAVSVSDDTWVHNARELNSTIIDLVEQSRDTFIPALERSDTIFHPKFGTGKIDDVSRDTNGKEIIEVTFSSGQIKLSGSNAVDIRKTASSNETAE